MSKNPFKSFIKSVVRVFWKYFIDPVFINLLPASKAKTKLKNISYRIDRRMWWPKVPKVPVTMYIEHHASTTEHHGLHITSIDPYLLHELSELSKIEFKLQPTPHFLSQIQINQYQPPTHLESNSVGSQYALITRYLHNLSYDVVFLAPWLVRGGADLGTIHHVNAMHEKGYRILFITTEKSDNPWIDKLPKSVKHLDFYQFAHVLLPNNKQIELLARIILQSTAQTIHNINSNLGWQLYQNYGQQLKYMGKQLFASVFCEDIDNNGIYYGYSPAYIHNTHSYLSAVFCDTKWYPKTQIDLTGLDELFKTIYFPSLQKLFDYQADNKVNNPILWASRFATQKLPNILYDIAKSMPNQSFHVYGAVEDSCKAILEKLENLPNVTYFGKYDSFAKIANTTKYRAFLYTTQYDGLPNVLIEAISNGLPVITYDVCGIGELIHTDCLLSHDDSFDDNLKKIATLLNSPEILKQSWQYSHDILKNRHSWQHFIESLNQIDGYFPRLTQGEYYEKNYGNIRVLSKPTI